jgi:hypothetical protein
MIEDPADTPHAKPDELMVATEVVPLVQRPPDIGSPYVVHIPTQTAGPPLIGPIGLTVIGLDTAQVPSA